MASAQPVGDCYGFAAGAVTQFGRGLWEPCFRLITFFFSVGYACYADTLWIRFLLLEGEFVMLLDVDAKKDVACWTSHAG
ncbi:hypothetical protein Nepgr_025990 [Nepenthes gracilis]|uniref:Uncharacterized protein n=1 Tax=Nepenthes gracilis TaxID=150966 RepID=A0AAD3Y002_NEPGR|nr:hypothetical protein Nepgr_025990 [Nepenthes gracilis]